MLGWKGNHGRRRGILREEKEFSRENCFFCLQITRIYFVCVGGGLRAKTRVRRLEANPLELPLSSYHEGPEDQIHIIRFSGELLYRLSHLAIPKGQLFTLKEFYVYGKFVDS